MECNNNESKIKQQQQLVNNGDVTLVDEEELNAVNGFFAHRDDDGHQHEEEEAFLYDSSMLERLDFSHLKCFNPAISAAQPGEGLRVRALSSGDYDRGFLQLLSQLTTVGNVSRADFLKRFAQQKACQGTYYVTVIEDTKKNEIIGAATLVLERKFIRECATRGIIEEVVVSDQYRGKQLGKLIVATLIELGKALGCYKITLNCTDQMINFYASLGFLQEEGNANFLMIRVPKTA